MHRHCLHMMPKEGMRSANQRRRTGASSELLLWQQGICLLSLLDSVPRVTGPWGLGVVALRVKPPGLQV